MEKIKAKIRALLAKAATSEHSHEAATFMAKAMELMEKHQLELHELGTDDPIGMTVGVTAQNGPPAYKSNVQCALARYYGCKPVIMWFTDRKWRVELVGPESARITTELMIDFVWKQVCDEAKALTRDVDGMIKHDAAIRQVSKALCVRIYREVADRAEAGPSPVGSSLSLLVQDQNQNWIDTHYEGLKDTKPRPVRIMRSAKDRAAGISLHHQAGNGTTTPRLQ